MTRKMRTAMQAERTLRAFTVSAGGRMHLTTDGTTFLHRDYPKPGDSRTITGTPAYLASIPARGNFCYACLRDNGPRAEILALGQPVPVRDPEAAERTRSGALKSAPLAPAPREQAERTRGKRTAERAPVATPATPSQPDLAALLTRLDAVLAESRDIAAAIARLGAPAPEPERAPEPATPAPKRTGKPRDGASGAADDAAVVAAAVAAWTKHAAAAKSERNSAAYRALCAARPGMARETRESLWNTFKMARGA